MGETTKIQWCDATFNPWIGCEKVSAGCRSCYASVSAPTRVHRSRGLELWGPSGSRVVTSASNWTQPRRWNREALEAGERRRVFCASLADIFEDRPELQAPRQRLFGLIEECEGLDWLLLTKRPENMLTMTASRWARWPDNVWAGTTAENREELKNRAVWLQDVPAKIRFLSCEPLLESLPELENYLDWISWVIVGGESGKGARPFHMNWASNIIHDCAYANVPCFVKQMGENVRDWNARGEREDIADFDKAALGDTYSKRIFFTGKGADPEEWPPSLRVRQFPEARP